MPGAHRNTDSRFCGAETIVTGQSSVFVNGLLWAVVGDKDSHCNEGDLSAVYGALNVYVENKLVICAVGDTAAPDTPNCIPPQHPSGATDPQEASPDVFVYE